MDKIVLGVINLVLGILNLSIAIVKELKKEEAPINWISAAFATTTGLCLIIIGIDECN
jgi:hypothetical protein